MVKRKEGKTKKEGKRKIIKVKEDRERLKGDGKSIITTALNLKKNKKMILWK